MKGKENILQLYENNIDSIYSKSVKKSEITKNIIKETEKLTITLNQEQRDIFDCILDLESEKNEVIYKNIFVEAFSLAISLIIEGINKSKD